MSAEVTTTCRPRDGTWSSKALRLDRLLWRSRCGLVRGKSSARQKGECGLSGNGFCAESVGGAAVKDGRHGELAIYVGGPGLCRQQVEYEVSAKKKKGDGFTYAKIRDAGFLSSLLYYPMPWRLGYLSKLFDYLSTWNSNNILLSIYYIIININSI